MFLDDNPELYNQHVAQAQDLLRSVKAFTTECITTDDLDNLQCFYRNLKFFIDNSDAVINYHNMFENTWY